MYPQLKLCRHVSLVMMLSFLALGPLACSSDAPEPETAPADRPHGNHDPGHGGLVLMDRDLHFEVVLRPPAEYRVFFSDEVRKPVPASSVTDVLATVTSTGEPPEVIGLQVDGRGESWVGKGQHAVRDPEATVRISYVYRNEPYWIDIAVSSLQNPPPKAGH